MIRIVTDTTSGLPSALAERYDIPIVPQVIIFGEEEYLELEEMSIGEFMLKLTSSNQLPKTAAPTPVALENAYRRFVDTGDTILSIHPSTDLSGTVRSATIAARSFPEADIRILDTRTIGAPLGRIVVLAARWAADGVAADDIMARLQALIPKQRLYFLVDTLEYLQKGGRIGGASAFLGGILQMKPILALIDGRVEPIERQRTQRRARQRLKEIVVAESARGEEAQLSIMHADCLETAKALAADLQRSLDTFDFLLMDLVPAIVTHAGPGALAVGFIAAEKS